MLGPLLPVVDADLELLGPGRFRVFVAGRSDATSTLDPGLGSVLGCFTSAVELFQQTSSIGALTVN